MVGRTVRDVGSRVSAHQRLGKHLTRASLNGPMSPFPFQACPLFNTPSWVGRRHESVRLRSTLAESPLGQVIINLAGNNASNRLCKANARKSFSVPVIPADPQELDHLP